LIGEVVLAVVERNRAIRWPPPNSVGGVTQQEERARRRSRPEPCLKSECLVVCEEKVIGWWDVDVAVDSIEKERFACNSRRVGNVDDSSPMFWSVRIVRVPLAGPEAHKP